MPIDAERWLASRGIEREPLLVPREAETAPAGPPPGVRETVDAARQAAVDAAAQSPSALSAPDGPSDGPSDGSVTNDDPDAALAFVQRSTSNAPQSEGRLRAKLLERGFSAPAAEEALVRARAQRLVDDDAMLAALIGERRARGHADTRLRRDLRDRGFTGPQVDAALEIHAHTDPAAAAFALAQEQARRHRGLDAEVAVRRTIGYLVRRGHGDGLARKAARDAVYADREAQQVAGR